MCVEKYTQQYVKTCICAPCARAAGDLVDSKFTKAVKRDFAKMSDVQRAGNWLVKYLRDGLSWPELRRELSQLVPEPTSRAVLVAVTQDMLRFGTDHPSVRAPILDAIMRWRSGSLPKTHAHAKTHT